MFKNCACSYSFVQKKNVKKHGNIDNNINFKSKNGEQEKLNSFYVRHFTKKIKDICKLFGLD